MVASSLRIAMMLEVYYPNIGGQEVFFQELGETLVRRGHSVDVYCIANKPGLPQTEELNGITIHRNPNGGRYLQPPVPAMRRSWLDIVKFSAGVRRVASAHQHDFYLLNQWPLMHAVALPKNVRALSAIHWCEIRTDPVLTRCQKRLPRIVGSNFAVSAAVAAEITRQSGRPCGVLPSGIQLSRYRNTPRGKRAGVLSLGRIAAHKNLSLLIDAYEIAVAGGLDGDLLIAGDGPARPEVEAYVRRSPLASRIQVLGSVTEEQKLELLSQAAVFGMPSMREGFPRVITEAMASGLPVVTSDYAGNGSKEVVAQYKSGIVCGTTAADFAEALLATEADWDRYSQAGLAAAQTLDWSHIAETLEARIREVLAK
ncbi:glycosyltransferase family 4 protein [Mycolicibacterium aichiense]|uniref:glycosyltransferase family 4 protein n=1 Tax=Mycolicibacterium aichiense TaxID=1799 RepID=UPI003D664CDA